MEPGFAHFGWREAAALLLALAIVADWSAQRYLRSHRRVPPDPRSEDR
jgi:hypothetical protein